MGLLLNEAGPAGVLSTLQSPGHNRVSGGGYRDFTTNRELGHTG